ncbi:MAG: hypothetical protein KBA85_10270, partial [Chloroflexi bacterium]|nr:hypothetical protein [Chloroflexota bacterium]
MATKNSAVLVNDHTTRRISRFDLAIWATVGGALLLTAVLAWWNGRATLPTFAESTAPRILYIGWDG